MYTKRTLERSVLEASRTFPVVLVTGPRQVGKTTMLRHLASDRTYVTLDDLGPRELARSDPGLFFQRYPPPVLVDEVQQAPGLLDQVKVLVDRDPGARGAFWLTGSQHFALMRGVSESLAGRVCVLRMLGFSVAEEAGRGAGVLPFRPDRIVDAPSITVSDVFTRIVRGAYPRLAQPDAPARDLWYGSYVQTYVERDVRAMLDVARLQAFETFLRVAAARVGQLINLADMARDIGVAPSTVQQWLAVMEATFQILLLRPYHTNRTSRETKTPKLYFLDTGLAAWLGRWSSAETAAAGAMAGALLENHVVAEVAKSWWHRGREAPLWFWRTKDGAEVDLIVEDDGLLYPVEVKLASRPDRRALTGIGRLRATGVAVGPGCVACLADSRWPIDGYVEAMNVASIA